MDETTIFSESGLRLRPFGCSRVVSTPQVFTMAIKRICPLRCFLPLFVYLINRNRGLCNLALFSNKNFLVHPQIVLRTELWIPHSGSGFLSNESLVVAWASARCPVSCPPFSPGQIILQDSFKFAPLRALQDLLSGLMVKNLRSGLMGSEPLLAGGWWRTWAPVLWRLCSIKAVEAHHSAAVGVLVASLRCRLLSLTQFVSEIFSRQVSNGRILHFSKNK